MNTNGTEKYAAGLAAWRASQLHEMVLPSGLEVRLKRVSMEDLVMGGNIPDTLSGMVDSLISGKGGDLKIGMNNLQPMVELFNVICIACIVNPPVAQHADDTHLGVNELSFADKQAIFDWANGDAKALRPFRDQRKELADPDESAPVGQGVSPTAVGDSGDSERLDGIPV